MSESPTLKLALLYWRDYAYVRPRSHDDAIRCRLCQTAKGQPHDPGCAVGQFEKERKLTNVSD